MHPTHLTTVMEAIDCYVAADELAQGFELKVCESQGHLCEIVLSGVPRVRASTCLNIARNVALRCSRVRAGGGDVRLTVDARAVVVARDVLLHARGGCAAYVDCLVREHVSREGWNSLQIKLEPI